MTLLSHLGASPLAPAPESPRAPHRRWPVPAALAAALLAACASTPLPPWPATPAATVVQAPRAPTAPGPAAEQPRPGVVTAPVVTTLPQASVDTAAQESAPYGPAVAARFPDPGIRYDTPGLAPERRAFTTNAEIGQWLQRIASGSASTGTRTALLALGPSQRGNPIHAMVLTHAGGTSPDQLSANQRPTVLLMGQQHGDEPAGSEALLVVAKELAQGLLEPLLERINVIVVPRANPDGAEASTRATANGMDMDRDHLLLNTPEARALAALVRDYRPILVIDAHEFTVAGPYLEKFHALQRYDALLQYAGTANLPEFLVKASKEWYHAPMVTALQAQNLSTEWYFTTSMRPDDLTLSMGGTQPDTARNVNGLKNAVSLLVETRGVGIGRAHIQRRVHTQITAVTSALRSTAERAANLEQVRSFVVRDTSAQACRDQMVVEAGPTREQRDITMLDPDTGADRVLRVDWNSSLALRNLKSRPRPCGYWLSADADAAIERLRLLGVQVLRVAEPGGLLADTYRETSSARGVREDVRGPMTESADIVRAQVALVRSAIDVPAGSYYVPLNQAMAYLAVAALEPDTQNSYFANHVIERLEHSARVMATPSLVFEETD
ncbi:peptidase M14 [Acidovorax sp. SRB_14]|uniref:M14 family zinc carboxypeptidase n=1 Tax=Acidovorax sp. SRB_14 TaxID=1962699 RepID=UPI001563F047|nr:peptidase M14 [Acidovorax sp. SRB_14]